VATKSCDLKPIFWEYMPTARVRGDLGCVDPRHMREFEQLMGMRVFKPNVPGASMGVTGPDE
jgi:hypothetical protein